MHNPSLSREIFQHKYWCNFYKIISIQIAHYIVNREWILTWILSFSSPKLSVSESSNGWGCKCVIFLHGSPSCPRLPPLADSLGDALLHLTLLFMQIKKGQINEGHPGEPPHNAGRENESLDTMCATRTQIGSTEFAFLPLKPPSGKTVACWSSEVTLSQWYCLCKKTET